MSSPNAENSTLISDYSSTEFRNIEFCFKSNFDGSLFVYIKEVNVLASPLKVMDKLAWTVGLLEDEGIIKELWEFVKDMDMWVVSYSAGELS